MPPHSAAHHSAKRHSAKRLLALLAAAGGSCTSFAGAPQAYVRSVELPSDLAAAIAAGAVRLALTFADPVPAAAGAPADDLGGGRYTITYELDDRGNWTPAATHRLTVVCSEAPSPRIDVRADPLSGNLALPALRHATARLSIEVLPAPGGAIVNATLPDQVGARVAQFLDSAFAVAIDPSAVRLGLDEPNLEALACHRLRTTADDLLEHGRPRLAEQHLLRATRLHGGTSGVHRRLGELAARSGDDVAARDQFTQGLLVATDPTARAHLASLLAEQCSGAADRAHLHRQADECAAADDLDGAETLLHTARRRTPLPAEDYLLTSHLHLRRHDPMAALGCALLAREYEGAPAAAVGPAVAHHSTTPEDVAGRFLREARTFATPSPAAAPPR